MERALNMAKKNKERVDTSMDQGEFANNPFAALGGLDLPDKPLVQEKPKAQIMAPYTVTKTKKGKWPVRMEKRGNKVVTVVANVSGDTKALLKALQKHLGVGGKAEPDNIQVQGEHVAKVEAFLDSE
jgi:translation initiation factor 1 (eIF-1/SUI1)